MTKDKPSVLHEPVLLSEVIEGLHIKTSAYYIDATIGTAGHSREIVKRGGFVLGIDADRNMLTVAKRRLEDACRRTTRSSNECFKLTHGNFRDIAKIAQAANTLPVSGIIFDLGISNVHFAASDRGFSFSNESAVLDMRLDTKAQKLMAKDLLNALREDQLKTMFFEVMTRGASTKLAREVVRAREDKRIETVGDFLKITSFLKKKGKLHPATKAFLALRMSTNSEIDNITDALPAAFGLLESKGRLLVISFHSLEDTVVKRFFRQKKSSGEGVMINKKPIEASAQEVARNPKSRSAKLRILEKI